MFVDLKENISSGGKQKKKKTTYAWFLHYEN